MGETVRNSVLWGGKCSVQRIGAPGKQALDRLRERRGQRPVLRDELRPSLLRLLQDREVRGKVADAEHRQAMLAAAEKVAGAALLQVGSVRCV